MHIFLTRKSFVISAYVETVTGLLQSTLGENPPRGNGGHAQADLQTVRNLRRLRRLGTWLTQGLIEQIGENPACLLEAIGADVGQVVGNDVNLHLLGSKAGTGGPQ